MSSCRNTGIPFQLLGFPVLPSVSKTLCLQPSLRTNFKSMETFCLNRPRAVRIWSLCSPFIHKTALTHWLRVPEFRSPAPFAVSWNKYWGITYTLGSPVVLGWNYLLWLIGNHTPLGSFPFGISTPGYRFLLEAFLYKSFSWKSLPNPCLSPTKTSHEKLVKLYEVKW